MDQEASAGEDPSAAARPYQPRKKLFMALLALFVAWIALLIALNLAR